MQIIQLSEASLEDIVARATPILRAAGVILYPTDTLYGLGADAFSDEAVAKVYAIKGRDEKKPIHCIVADLEAAEHFAEVNDAARKLAEKFLPGPLTLVLKKLPNVSSGIAKELSTVGIRIPDNEFCIKLAREFGPYTTTSANIAGAEDLHTVTAILEQLGEKAGNIDLAIDASDPPAGGAERKPSTVVDVSSGVAKILREGAISSQDILSTPGV